MWKNCRFLCGLLLCFIPYIVNGLYCVSCSYYEVEERAPEAIKTVLAHLSDVRCRAFNKMSGNVTVPMDLVKVCSDHFVKGQDYRCGLHVLRTTLEADGYGYSGALNVTIRDCFEILTWKENKCYTAEDKKLDRTRLTDNMARLGPISLGPLVGEKCFCSKKVCTQEIEKASSAATNGIAMLLYLGIILLIYG